MIDLGANAAFVWASYGAVAFVLTGLVIWLFADGSVQRRKLDALEARGTRRRSAGHTDAAQSENRC